MVSAAEQYAAFKERQKYHRVSEFAANLEFQLDDFQYDACKAINANRNVVVSAPTGAGKTIIAVFALEQALIQHQRAFYTTPIKALSNQKYRELCARFGAENIGLMTGDTSINREAPIIVMTTEVVRNMIYRGVDLDDLGFIILDEVHYLADRERGPVWEEVLIHAPAPAQIVALSATIRNAGQFAAWIESLRGPTEVVQTDFRPVPLEHSVAVGERIYPVFRSGEKGGDSTRLNAKLVEAIERCKKVYSRPDRAALVAEIDDLNLAPALYFIFSRAGCEDAAKEVAASGFHVRRSATEMAIVDQIIDTALAQVDPKDWGVLGINSWRMLLEQGIGVHHAGLLPAQKTAVEILFNEGLLRVVFATETLALGINMPARAVVIERLQKFDGATRVPLSAGIFRQLGGRAGRRGIDDAGDVIIPYIRGNRMDEIRRVTISQPEPLESAFQPTYNMVVNLLSRTDFPRARAMMERSFAQFCLEKRSRALLAKEQQILAQIDQIAAKLECECGDVIEYIKLEDSTKAQRGEEENIYLTGEQMLELKRGEIISVQVGARNRVAIVTTVRANPTEVEAVVEDGSVRTFRSGICAILDYWRLAGDFKASRPRARKELASQLRRARRDGAFPTFEAAVPTAGDLHPLRTHPVRQCWRFDKHMRQAKRYLRAQRGLERLTNQRHTLSDALGIQFDRITKVLKRHGYLDQDGIPTEAGQVLATIYARRELLIAQAATNGMFENQSTPVLAALIAAVIYDGSDTSYYQPSSKKLREALVRLEKLQDEIITSELSAGLEADSGLNLAIVQATYLWSTGRPLAECIGAVDLAAGDFVRWMRSVIDALAHLRVVLGDSKVDAAINSLRRGVVT